MRGDFVPPAQGILREMWRSLHGQSTSADRATSIEAVQNLEYAPPAGAGAVVEVRTNAGIGKSMKPVDDLVDGLVAIIAIRDGKFCAFFEVQDE